MLDQYFPGVFQSIECTGFFDGKARSKADVCKQLGADLLIDDHLHHAKAGAQIGIDSYPATTRETRPIAFLIVCDESRAGTKLLMLNPEKR